MQIRLISLVTAFVALALVSLIAGPAAAGDCGSSKCWGAVGIGANGAYGFAYGYVYESDAVSVAQNGCAGNCNNIRTFYNTCGAMASGSNQAWGYGWAGTRAQAEANALGFCRENGRNCIVRVWACSP